MLQRCSSAPAKSLTCRFTSSLTAYRLHQGFVGLNVTARCHFAVRAAATSAGGEPDGRCMALKGYQARSRTFAMMHMSFMCNQITSLPDYSYLTLAAPHTVTIEIKKSKFITTAWPTTSPEEVSDVCISQMYEKNCLKQFVGTQVYDRFKAGRRLFMQALQLVAAAKDPAASHNCFAYKIGEQVAASQCTGVMQPCFTLTQLRHNGCHFDNENTGIEVRRTRWTPATCSLASGTTGNPGAPRGRRF